MLDEAEGVDPPARAGRDQVRQPSQMLDNRGQPLLTPLSLRVPRPSVVAVIGPHGGARDVLGRILGRQAMSYSGRVMIDGEPISRACRSSGRAI